MDEALIEPAAAGQRLLKVRNILFFLGILWQRNRDCLKNLLHLERRHIRNHFPVAFQQLLEGKIQQVQPGLSGVRLLVQDNVQRLFQNPGIKEIPVGDFMFQAEDDQIAQRQAPHIDRHQDPGQFFRQAGVIQESPALLKQLDGFTVLSKCFNGLF